MRRRACRWLCSRAGRDIAARSGLILVDTKFEFGLDDTGRITLADEILTPDSSRYWLAASYAERRGRGEEPGKPGQGVLKVVDRRPLRPLQPADPADSRRHIGRIQPGNISRCSKPSPVRASCRRPSASRSSSASKEIWRLFWGLKRFRDPGTDKTQTSSTGVPARGIDHTGGDTRATAVSSGMGRRDAGVERAMANYFMSHCPCSGEAGNSVLIRKN